MNDHINQKVDELEKSFEAIHRDLILNTYKCMRDCYSRAVAIEYCNDCSEYCFNYVRIAQNHFMNNMAYFKSFFHSCTGLCKHKYHYKNEPKMYSECCESCKSESEVRFRDVQRENRRLADYIIKKLEEVNS